MVLPAPTLELAADEPAAKQIRFQADQLAGHLRTRQKELDAREAELNSRLAQFESETRAARLWLEQHEADLSARDEVLAKREEDCRKTQREADRRLARLAKAEAALQRRSGTDTPPGESAAVSLEEVVRPSAETPVDLGIDWQASRPASSIADEPRLARLQAEVQALYEQLVSRQKTFDEEVAETRQRMAAEHEQAMADVQQRRDAIQRQSEHLDRSRATLQQLRDEVGRVHRETLELRLTAEELWAQLCGAAPPAVVTQSLGRIRARLTEQYRGANAELAERKQELEAIRGQLLEQHAKLVEHKQQFDAWITSRQEDCQQQAARLVAREQQLRCDELQLSERLQTHFAITSPCLR
jgi:septal ring factor EnvC (AmiA/AmiB activator)